MYLVSSDYKVLMLLQSIHISVQEVFHFAICHSPQKAPVSTDIK